MARAASQTYHGGENEGGAASAVVWVWAEAALVAARVSACVAAVWAWVVCCCLRSSRMVWVIRPAVSKWVMSRVRLSMARACSRRKVWAVRLRARVCASVAWVWAARFVRQPTRARAIRRVVICFIVFLVLMVHAAVAALCVRGE